MSRFGDDRPMDDRRVGLIVRALRRRRGWRQADLAGAAHLSQTTISTLERGHLDHLSFVALRAVFVALEARTEIDIRWRGGALDRTLDEDHAQLGGAIVAELGGSGWLTAVEVTYAVYGERGSIDVLAFHEATRSLLVIEVKTELTSVEETLRRHDQKVRLAARIARDRFGWQALTISRLLVLPETSTTREQVARHAHLLESVLPADNIAIHRWLRRPTGSISGRWFFRLDRRRGMTRSGGRERIRRPRVDPSG